MRKILYNIGYFLRETKTILWTNALSNIFSLLSIGLIFFMLAMVISGWWASNQIIEAIQGEAEINVYYEEGLDDAGLSKLTKDIKSINGVKETNLVNNEEARSRMEDILGKEAAVLQYLEENPFEAFIEVKIDMDKMNYITERLRLTQGIDYIRDNRDILDKIQNISGVLKLLGYMIVVAVGISTLVIIAHIIRQGIYNSREQINTLRLLGAPEAFIAFPFTLVGLILNLGGGIVASALTSFTINYVYAQIAGPLPFIPLPPAEILISGVIGLVIPLSAALGILGSLFGLSSAKE